MSKVVLREGETSDELLARFKREVKKSGVLDICKSKEFFVNKATKRRLKSKAAAARIRSKKPRVYRDKD